MLSASMPAIAAGRAGPGQRLLAAGSRLATAAWHGWSLDRHVEFWLRELGTSWSFTAPRARVVKLIDETADTRTLVLAPGGRWPGHRAGQYVEVEVEVDGARVRRCYSISSGGGAPGARRIAITVRRVAGGRASSALHKLRRGALVGLGRPAGDFVLDSLARPKLLLVGAGSGITPIMALIRDLVAQPADGASGAVDQRDVVVIHGSRGAGDAIFGRELAGMAARFEWLRVHARRDDALGAGGRLDARRLRALVPDLADRETFVCGPPGLIDVVTRAAGEAGAGHRVHQERFITGVVHGAGARAATIALLRTGIQITATGPGPLLAQLERAGQRPAYGCRMGICGSCRCRKLRGTVEDGLTGVVSSEPDQDIRLCVSIARSDLELAL